MTNSYPDRTRRFVNQNGTLDELWYEWFEQFAGGILSGTTGAGYLAGDGLGNLVPRTLVAGSGVTITNPTGASGNSTISINAGTISHSGLLNLSADDHTQYYNSSRLTTWLAGLTTTSLAEGTNLYYTPARIVALIQNGTGITWTYSGGLLTGNVSITQYTDEMAQDAVGNALVDSSTIDFTYNDAGNSITATVIQSGITHANLASLSADDHTQYMLLAGRSGGQTLIGGTSASNNLTLQTTSNITKGSYILSELSSNGFVKTSGGTGTLSIDTSSYQPLASQLTTLASYNTNGLFTQTAAGSYTGRTITANSTKIAITNGSGVSGNPTVDVTEANLTHNNIGGLTTGDPHTQYVLLAGRSGGQSITGGTAGGNNLTLNTTSNASKGSYILTDLSGTGFVKGTSGTLSIDTTSYAPAANTVTLTGTSNQITVTGAAQALSVNPSFTLAIPTTFDLSSNTWFKIPAGTAPTVDASGKIAIDTNTDNSNVTQGSIEYHDGTNKMYVTATDALPSTDGYVLTYDGTAKKYKWAVAPGASGGAPTNASYITQVSETGLSAEFALSTLTTGFLKVTTSTGALASTGDGSTFIGTSDIAASAITYAKIQNVSANKILGNSTGSGAAVAEIACTAAGLTLLNGANAAAQVTSLGLTIGTNTEAWSAQLDSLAALGSNGIICRTASNTVTNRQLAAGSGITITNPDGVSGNPTITAAAPVDIWAVTFAGAA